MTKAGRLEKAGVAAGMTKGQPIELASCGTDILTYIRAHVSNIGAAKSSQSVPARRVNKAICFSGECVPPLNTDAHPGVRPFDLG